MTTEEQTFNKLKEPAPKIDAFGTKRWYNEKGELHRENDLPAIIWIDGSKFWYKNGKFHRENGNATIFFDGEGAHLFKAGVRIK